MALSFTPASESASIPLRDSTLWRIAKVNDSRETTVAYSSLFSQDCSRVVSLYALLDPGSSMLAARRSVTKFFLARLPIPEAIP